MAHAVKTSSDAPPPGKAPSDTPGRSWRDQQAAATKDRIADAGRRLFSTRGYGATSIEAIAREAGVAVRTVYAAFGTKREILSHICEAWLERAHARETAGQVLAEPDAERRLAMAAHWLTHLYAAGFDVVEMFEGAMDDSPETRDLLRAKLAGRDGVMNQMIASLGGRLVVPLDEAQSVFRALAAPPLYRELVIGAGWSADELAEWIGGILHRHLLGA